jgi:hypothetical protein
MVKVQQARRRSRAGIVFPHGSAFDDQWCGSEESNWMPKPWGLGRSLVARVVIAILFCGLYGCAPPVQKVARPKIDRPHHHTTVGTDSRAHHELSETEKAKLFQDFERWHAAKGPVEPATPSLVEIEELP